MGSQTVMVDSQLPVISGAFSGTTGSNGWYVGPVSFSGSASDATSGLASFTCTLDGISLGLCNWISVNDEGSHTLVLSALDNAGNPSIVAQDISIDTQSPTLSSSLQGTLGSNSWYNDAALHATASDPVPGSGLSLLEYSIDTISWSIFPSAGVLDLPDGKHSVDVRATDNAGHSVSSSKSFQLDSVAPGILLDPQGTLGANDWYITSLKLAASVSDETSGVDIFEYSDNGGAWTTYAAPLVLMDGSHNISFWGQDKAGLVTQIDRLYKVDTVRPQIAGSLSGTPGTNGWYVSNVVFAASAVDPLPGSGVDAFTYILNQGPETPYTNALTIPDGLHTIRLNVQDKAGLIHFTDQSVKVDTIRPSLAIQTTLPNWIKDKVTLSGSAGDSGSGLSKVEISTNNGRSWQTATGTNSWSYIWDTAKDFDGVHNVIVRAVDQAGLTTEQTITTGVDNKNPTIILPASWLQWETVPLDIWDDESGLSVTRIEISDPTRRYPKRTIQFDYAQFPLSFKWDRRFGDNSIAPNGNYDVTVTAIDHMGNVAHGYASLKVLLDILPAGPTTTPQPYSRTTPTPLFTSTPLPTALSATTATAVVSMFGEIQPTAPVALTPEASLTPRATPTQTNLVEWLESVLLPRVDSTDQITELDTSVYQPARVAFPGTESGVLWGAAAAAMIGAVTSFTLEEKRKREAAAYAPEPEEDPEAALEARRAKNRTKKMKKLEAQWAQERDWEIARLTEQALDNRIKAKLTEREIEDHLDWMTLQAVTQARAEEQRHDDKLTRDEEKQSRLDTYVERQPEEKAPTPLIEKTWWQKGIDWIDEHQTEIALGIGVAVGVAAIVLSGGTATPLVAAAWIAGAAAIAGGTAALGTIALNRYYERDWNENLLGNVLAAAVTAAAVTGITFLFQAATYKAATYCISQPVICGSVAPLVKLADTGEELWLSTQLGYQTLTHDPGAAETALELHMELIDGGMVGNAVGKDISTETAEKLAQYGDEALDLVKLHGEDAIPIILNRKQQGISLLRAHGEDLTSAVAKYGDDAVELFARYDDETVDFIKRAEKMKVNPTTVLRDTPSPGQSLEGWLLGIENLESPVNKPNTLKLSEEKVQDLLGASLQRPESNEFVVGYFDPERVDGYEEVADARNATKLSMPQPLYKETGFQDNTGDFWPINRAAIQYGIDNRKTFVLSTSMDTILSNPEKYTYAEIKMILHPSSGYTYVYQSGYDMLVPTELLQP